MTEIRICENCGARNPVSNLECENCGYDITFCIPIDSEEIVNADVQSDVSGKQWVFTAIDESSVSFSVKDDEELNIGRENCVISDYLNKSDYISRVHCKIYANNEELHIVDASTNGTYINGKRIDKLKDYKLNNGDEVTFADIKFKISK